MPKAIIVPHAGYIYSGAVAAAAYARLGRGRSLIRRVVLLGPVHRVPVRGLALPADRAFETPLGRIALDEAAIAALRRLPQVVESAAVHAEEHSLEVHLPFLQRLLENFTLVPLAVGDATREEVAEALDLVWGGAETLIVVSSDLSHYLPYEAARKIDAETAAMIVDLRSDIDHRHACGGTPVNGLLLTALKRKLREFLGPWGVFIQGCDRPRARRRPYRPDRRGVVERARGHLRHPDAHGRATRVHRFSGSEASARRRRAAERARRRLPRSALQAAHRR